MSAERLAVGDLVRCPRCRGRHPTEQSAGGCATDYATSMLFYRCGRELFYAGQIGGTAQKLQDVHRRVTMNAWTLTLDGHVMTCQIRQDSGGWDAVLYLDGEALFSRRCFNEVHAQFVASGLKQDELAAGWID